MKPPENTMSEHFPAAIFKMITPQLDPFVDFYRRFLSDYYAGGIWFQLHALVFWSTIAVIFMIACLHVKMKKEKFMPKSKFGTLQALTFIAKVNDDEFVDADAKFAEDLQVQEYLLDSFIASQAMSNASSSVQARDILDSKPVKIDREITNPPQSFCEICLENKERWQMFSNNSCFHTFCFDCTSKHIVAKIENNTKTISCPGINCIATLDSDVCRLIIPLEAVVHWDESLCKSLIPNNQKTYCPFRDCSTLLVDDSGVVIKKTKCPLCKRSFCARCRVPWHSEFTCEEVQTLNAKTGRKDERMVKSLAKKKNWQKCPHCKMYVERSEGCSHMTCRCGYEFCYRCGRRWTGCNGGCRLTP